LLKQNRYSTSHSRFFFVYSASNDANLCNPDKSRWQKMDSGQPWLLCANNLKGLPVDIGNRHENGDGVFLRIKKRKESISFETDEMSGVPVFWLEQDDLLVIVSDLSLLTDLAKSFKIKLDVNLKSASEILIAGYIFSDQETLIKGANVLPPRSRLNVNLLDGSLEIRFLGEDFRYQEDILSAEESLEKFQNSLIQGLKRHKRKKVAALLSGGADSRAVALHAVLAGLNPDFFTFGQSTVNASDFSIANVVVYCFGKKTKCFTASAKNFGKNWKLRAAASNWINDSLWWAGMLPDELLEELQNYDVVLRGDGDGCYGWKRVVANLSDALHRIEITPEAKAWEFGKYFRNPKSVLGPGIESRNQLIEKYRKSSYSLRDLKNILYKEIREWRCIAPGAWNFSRVVPIDSPFLWQEPLDIAKRLPKRKRSNKWIIFESLKQDPRVKNVPFSAGASWNNHLEFYYSGVWEELLDYVKQWSPWPLNIEALRNEFLKPPDIPQPPSIAGKILDASKKFLQNHKYVRSIGLRYFPSLVGTSMSDRILIRIALVSSLCEELASSEHPVIIQTSKRKA